MKVCAGASADKVQIIGPRVPLKHRGKDGNARQNWLRQREYDRSVNAHRSRAIQFGRFAQLLRHSLDVRLNQDDIVGRNGIGKDVDQEAVAQVQPCDRQVKGNKPRVQIHRYDDHSIQELPAGQQLLGEHVGQETAAEHRCRCAEERAAHGNPDGVEHARLVDDFIVGGKGQALRPQIDALRDGSAFRQGIDEQKVQWVQAEKGKQANQNGIQYVKRSDFRISFHRRFLRSQKMLCPRSSFAP